MSREYDLYLEKHKANVKKGDDFCRLFNEVFTSDQITDIEVACQYGGIHLDYFTLFHHDDEFYIVHRNSGIMISYYKNLGRINTYNRPGFTLDDFGVFLKLLKEELLGYGLIK